MNSVEKTIRHTGYETFEKLRFAVIMTARDRVETEVKWAVYDKEYPIWNTVRNQIWNDICQF